MPRGVYLRTEEMKKNMSKAHCGKSSGSLGKHWNHSEDTRKKLSELNSGDNNPMFGRCGERHPRFGKHHSEDTKKRISESQTGEKSHMFGKNLSEDTKKKIGEANVGSCRSEEARDKMSKSHIGKFQTEETKKKISDSMRGEKCYAWKGGISKQEYTENWTDILKESIRCRDKYMCRLCLIPQTNKAFDVHHIDYDKKHCDPKNLITLCRCCHMKTNGNRKHWVEYFIKLDMIFE